MSKSDIALAILAIIAVVLGLAAFQSINKKTSQLALKKEMQLVALMREMDCVSCIEKVVCYWTNLEEDFLSQGIQVRLIFVQESPTFQKEELEHLCQVPSALEIIPYPSIEAGSNMPLSTPAIYLSNGDKILHMEPIFLASNIEEIHQRLSASLGLFLPKAK